MLHSELRQIFNISGVPVKGAAISPEESRKNIQIIVGVVHLWVWRRTIDTGIEVLLQKRPMHRPNWPGLLDTSVGGHVDVGESLGDAMKRESLEEIGLKLDIERLEYIFSYRSYTEGFKWVYIYELEHDVNFVFNDGEVEAVEWVSLAAFETMVSHPGTSNLREHTPEYLKILISALDQHDANH